MKRYAVVTGYEGFQGLVLPTNIEEFSKNNFSKKSEENIDCKEVAKNIYSLKENEKNEIVEQNYGWLRKNRNIQNNLYEVKEIKNIENPLKDIEYKEVIEILFGELQYMHTWMQKEIDRGWDVRQKTEDYYLNREKWNEEQMKFKENIIEKTKKENIELNKRLDEILKSNSWNFINKIKSNKILSKIISKINRCK